MNAKLFVGAAATLLLISGCTEDKLFPAPDIRVDKVTPSGCYIVCPEHAPTFEGSPQLGTPCDEGQAEAKCGFAGGGDRVRIVADLGDLPLDRGQTVTLPETVALLDGVPQVMKGVVDRSASVDRSYFAVTFPAPAKLVPDFAVRIEFSDSFFAEASGFQISAPVPVLSVTDCSPGSCAREANVGVIAAKLTAPLGLLGERAIFRSALDGVPTGRVDEVTLAAGDDDMAFAVVSIPVPDSVPDTGHELVWTIQANVGVFFADPVNIDVQPPSLALDIQNCPPPQEGTCSLAAGSTATIVVSAPKAIRTTNGTIMDSVDGVLTGLSVPVDLGAVQGDRRSGVRKLTVPSQVGKTWSLEAFLGEASVASIPVTILPPTSP